MKNVAGKLLVGIGATFIIGAVLCAFIAYFVFKSGDGGIMYDGWGRTLTDSPWFVRLFFGQDRLWVGWKWFGIDMLVFWSVMGISSQLLRVGFNIQK